MMAGSNFLTLEDHDDRYRSRGIWDDARGIEKKKSGMGKRGKRESTEIYTAVRKGRGGGRNRAGVGREDRAVDGEEAELIPNDLLAVSSRAVAQDETQWKPWEERPKFGAHRADLSYGLRSRIAYRGGAEPPGAQEILPSVLNSCLCQGSDDG